MWGHVVAIDLSQWPALLALQERIGRRQSVHAAASARAGYSIVSFTVDTSAAGTMLSGTTIVAVPVAVWRDIR